MYSDRKIYGYYSIIVCVLSPEGLGRIKLSKLTIFGGNANEWTRAFYEYIWPKLTNNSMRIILEITLKL